MWLASRAGMASLDSVALVGYTRGRKRLSLVSLTYSVRLRQLCAALVHCTARVCVRILSLYACYTVKYRFCRVAPHVVN